MNKEQISKTISLGNYVSPDNTPKEESSYYSLSFLKSILETSNEIIFHGNNIFHITDGKTKEYTLYDKEYVSMLLFKNICNQVKVSWNFSTPFASFKYVINNFNCRITLIHPCCNKDNKFKAYIRVQNHQSISFDLENSLKTILHEIIHQRKNLLISGATGSGKTTMLNHLLSFISEEEHIATIEDTDEIRPHHDNFTSLISDNDTSGKNMNDLLTYILRASPHRVILGEIRGSEASTYLMALNTGHSGSMSTIHSNGALDAINRLALLYNVYTPNPLDFSIVKQLICNSIDYCIQMKNKEIIEIIKVINFNNNKVIYEKVY